MARGSREWTGMMSSNRETEWPGEEMKYRVEWVGGGEM